MIKKNNLNTNIKKINWFPGHMNRAWNNFKILAPKLDLILLVLDARTVKSTFFEELIKGYENKTIKIILKKDLSSNQLNNSFNLLEKKCRNSIIALIEMSLSEKINKYQKKGLINPILQMAAIGLPNIGKSTLINLLANKKICAIADIPGLTRKPQKYKFKNNFWIYDTPGIFYPKIEDEIIGFKLALIGCVKRENIPLQETLIFAFNYLFDYYPNFLKKIIKNENLTQNFDEYLSIIVEKYLFYSKNNEKDYEKAMWYFFDCCRTCKYGTLSWDH